MAGTRASKWQNRVSPDPCEARITGSHSHLAWPSMVRPELAGPGGAQGLHRHTPVLHSCRTAALPPSLGALEMWASVHTGSELGDHECPSLSLSPLGVPWEQSCSSGIAKKE